MTDGGAKAERMQALVEALRHYDHSQLYFQIAEVAGERSYLRHGVEVGEGAVVLDVGANVGVAATFFAAQCGAALVHSFEPVPELFELLEENTSGMPACVCHPYGLGSEAGEAAITYYPGAAAMSGFYADPRRDRGQVRTTMINLGLDEEAADRELAGRYEARTVPCELRTLSGFLREERLERIDLLKIDVERAELDVLAGIGEGDWPRIAQLAVEVHDEDGRCARIEADLVGRGFRVRAEQQAAMRGTDVRMLYATRR